jgi:signal transduction histidine kinase
MRLSIPQFADALLIVVLLAVAEEEIWRVGVGGPARIAVPISTLGILALWWRRQEPLWSLVAVVASLTLLLAGGIEILGVGIAMVIADYSAAAHAATRRASLVAAAVVAGGVGLSVIAYPKANFGDLVTDAFFAAAAWAVGETVRRRTFHAADMERAATRLERTRADDVQAAAEGERMRIARELHDVIAHNVSAIVLQAIGGRGVLDSEPARVRQPLQEIEDLGRQTLAEMRRLLGVLRVGESESGRAPQPRLADIATLVEQANASGVQTALVQEGDLRAVPRGLELSVVRIVQEALTNVRKHAGAGAAASVHLHVQNDNVLIRIIDDGAGNRLTGHGSSGGHGLLGMQERVALYGGELQTRTLEPAGFELNANLPFTPTPPAS